MKEEEFDKFVNEIVEVRGRHWIDSKHIDWKIPLPKTNEEFKAFTKKYYGVELNADVVVMSEGITYKIKESHHECNKNCELYKMWDDKFGQYDGLKVLLCSIFGDLSCGGVATSHYGQTKLEKEKRDLLLNWDERDNTDKVREKFIEQDKDLRDIFGGINPLID